jgi:hypothetical protein
MHFVSIRLQELDYVILRLLHLLLFTLFNLVRPNILDLVFSVILY